MAALIYRRAFSDFYGLSMLGQRKEPNIEETRRRIFLTERGTDFGRPDHFYKGYLAHRLGEAKDVGELPGMVLHSLAKRYLERRNGKVMVRYELFGEWHELLPFISPLAIIVAFLVEEARGPLAGVDPRPFLENEIGETAFIGTLDLALDDLVARKGLHELHMHLNGSTELDVLWPQVCAAPLAFYAELKEAASKTPGPTAELYEQLEPGLTSLGIYKRLRAVRRVRRCLVNELNPSLAPARTDGLATTGVTALLETAEFDRSDDSMPFLNLPSLKKHPAKVLYAGKNYSHIIEEAAFLYACLVALKRTPKHRAIGTGLYFNFLVLTQIGRLTVQQVNESGFDQFQKYTYLGMRERIEKHYTDRFLQLNVSKPFQTLTHIEGRFAPKDSILKTKNLIEDIATGYLKFKKCGHAKYLAQKTQEEPLPGCNEGIDTLPPCLVGQPCMSSHCGKNGRPEVELSLVPHFIKELPKLKLDQARSCRDSKLRISLNEKARILNTLVTGNRKARTLLKGIDGAANELHAPPEAFAPAFRLVRYKNIPRATFHAGEDFLHLLSGIRAVTEAFTFLDLRAGDRIGHATAIGIDPSLWLSRTAPRLVLKKTDILDDAVFAHHALVLTGGFEKDLQKLKSLIAVHSEVLYGSEYSPDLLYRAWEMRHLDPLVVRKVENSLQGLGKLPTAETIATEAKFMASTRVDQALARELCLVADAVGKSALAYELFKKRHAFNVKKAEETAEIDAAVISAEAFVILQDYVLGLIKNRGVVLETLPTSNLRISFYNEMAEHHLYRWLGLSGPNIINRPTVCVGSDDPGIFATNLKNEYEAIGSVLRNHFKLTSAEASHILESLNDNGRTYRFKPGAN